MALLDEILAAEQQAAEQKKEALLSARELVRLAEADALSHIAQKNEEAKAQARQIVSNAQREADEQAALVEARSRSMCDALKLEARNKMPEAEAYILGRIVK